jgi:hypothetical protein
MSSVAPAALLDTSVVLGVELTVSFCSVPVLQLIQTHNRKDEADIIFRMAIGL